MSYLQMAHGTNICSLGPIHLELTGPSLCRRSNTSNLSTVEPCLAVARLSSLPILFLLMPSPKKIVVSLCPKPDQLPRCQQSNPRIQTSADTTATPGELRSRASPRLKDAEHQQPCFQRPTACILAYDQMSKVRPQQFGNGRLPSVFLEAPGQHAPASQGHRPGSQSTARWKHGLSTRRAWFCPSGSGKGPRNDWPSPC